MSVVIVGAGPTGLLLAGDLAEAGVPVTVLERRAEESNLTRAFGLHARSLELLDMRGLADRLVSEGTRLPEVRVRIGKAMGVLDMRHPESRFPFVLILKQARTEAALLERALAHGAEIVHGAEVVGLEQDARGAVVTTADGRVFTADHVVGCDGAHSAVRGLIGAGFHGRSYPDRILLADVLLKGDLEGAVNPFMSDDGVALLPPYGDGWFRATIWDRTVQDVPADAPLTLEQVRESLRRIAGDDFGAAEIGWSSRFLSERRQADRYRSGRVFLAGDAAHVHSPLGAMGMNTGIQDAANLAWKLIAAHRGWAPDRLLDTYHPERYPAGRSALRLTDAILRIATAPAPVRALRPYALPALLGRPAVRRRARRTISALNVHYPAPPGIEETPSIGRRVPDLPLPEESGGRLHARVHRDRFTLVDASADGTAAAQAAQWSDRVDAVRAGGLGLSTMDVLLVRPDGYLAWSGREPAAQQVRAALRDWCGAPS
ncbi:FAD-dependent oxidoreductase [Nocardiopsis composta]|uniref:2-polyprenyl-6-methoxyphenol hydroxylase-like FAD-dependent oxidoreductase n=1 Tax=Nocardiopsis composta TaxID=157465 RepID=A0A7W8QTA5_9ACTN|nr:FAD-dependent oxidoreductase [Nocardiopsis composta]MBB5436051.1 2-polyprenyl-6-methoxyphenol hydroxylase-like FAD-dependent oxidoreductase [Nocardiopsis composta]